MGKVKGKIVLIAPLTWEGVEHKELNFDMSNIKGKDLIDIQTEMKLAGIPLTSSMFIDEAYLGRLAALAANVHFDVIENLGFADFRQVINEIAGLML